MNTLYSTQSTFRSLLDAMSKPGKTVSLKHTDPSGKNAYAEILLIATTLMDHETSFCCMGSYSQGLVEQIYSLTKSRVAEDFMADFIVITGGSSNHQVAKAKIGTPEYPDEGATLIFQANGFDASPEALHLSISGPGIKDRKSVYLEGIDHSDIETIRDINRSYPQGVDCIFTSSKSDVICLPRSTRIEWE